MKNVKGTVVEVEHDAARVQFPNGDSRWFMVNNDAERKHFALGKKLTVQRRPMPKNREELFAYIKHMYPKNVEQFLTSWSEGTTKRKGKAYVKIVTGAGLAIAQAVHVFGTPDGKHFFVGRPGENRVSRHRYSKPSGFGGLEQGLVRISELVNAKIVVKKAA